MDHVAALFAPDRWLSVAERPGLIVPIIIASVVLTATATWLVLQLRYRGTIAKQRRRLKEFEDKLDGASPDETQRRIRFLQSRLDRLEPRHLSGRQQAVLKKRLSLPEGAGVTPINVVYDAACGDGKQYSAEFARIFRACPGWRASSGTVFGWGRSTGSGLAVVCHGRGRTAAAGKVLSKALTQAGIEHEIVPSPDEELELVITSRHSTPETSPDE